MLNKHSLDTFKVGRLDSQSSSNLIYFIYFRRRNTSICIGNSKKKMHNLKASIVGGSVDKQTRYFGKVLGFFFDFRIESRKNNAITPLRGDAIKFELKEKFPEFDQGYLAKIKESEIFLVQEVEKIAKKHGFGFIDVRQDVRSASKSQIIHGMVDQNHFNKIGYHVFSDSIINQSDYLKQFVQ